MAVIGILLVALWWAPAAQAADVEMRTPASLELPAPESGVTVKFHPKTGRPYPSIVPPGERAEAARPLAPLERPDYELLRAKGGEIPYHGPVSDRTKVYVLAGTLASAGVAAGVSGLAAAPAAAGAASGSPVVPAAAAAALLALEGDYVIQTLRGRPEDRNTERVSDSRVLEYGPGYKGAA